MTLLLTCNTKVTYSNSSRNRRRLLLMASYSNLEAIIRCFVYCMPIQSRVLNFILRHSTCLTCSTHSVYIYFSSGRSCSYSSVGPPGSGCCTVCSYLAPAKVSLSYNDGLSPVVYSTGEQNLAVQCNTHYIT